MPKNKNGGKNFKKVKKSSFEPDTVKNVPLCEGDGQAYARVIKMLGNRRVLVQFFDEHRSEMNCNIPKSFKREHMRVNNGDLVIVGTRPDLSNVGKGDIMYLYSHPEEDRLVSRKIVPPRETHDVYEDDKDGGFDFDLDDDEEVDLEDL